MIFETILFEPLITASIIKSVPPVKISMPLSLVIFTPPTINESNVPPMLVSRITLGNNSLVSSATLIVQSVRALYSTLTFVDAVMLSSVIVLVFTSLINAL